MFSFLLFLNTLILISIVSAVETENIEISLSNNNNNNNIRDSWTYPCGQSVNKNLPFCDTTLSFEERAYDLIYSRLTLEELGNISSNDANAVPRIGLPFYEWWNEALHGVANSPGVSYDGPISTTTMFPEPIGTASSFNRSLWYLIGDVVSTEARAMFNEKQADLTFWAPNINIFRDPRWGRGQETPGEDPFINGEYAQHFVLGMQGTNTKYLKVSSCCKHYAAYNLENYNGTTRYDFNAIVSDYDLNDTYLVAFKYCSLKGKASAVMCSYNSVNGIPSCANKYLLTTLLRESWDFNGYITSDCGAVSCVQNNHHYTNNTGDTIADVYNAGMDIACDDYTTKYLVSAVNNSYVGIDVIQQSLYRAALVQFRLGLFDPPDYVPWYSYDSSNVNTYYNQHLAYEAAQQSITLLKNDNNFLPITNYNHINIGLIGPNSNTEVVMEGNYNGQAPFIFSVKEGLESYISSKNISWTEGCTMAGNDTSGFQQAINIAKNSDLTIFVGGLDESQESEGNDRYFINLPGVQQTLIEQLIAVSKKFLLIILSGGCVDIAFADDNDKVGAIIWGGYGGMYGGQAIADVIFGKFNPVGKTTQTWYTESYLSEVSMLDMNIRPNNSYNYPGRGYRYYNGNSVLYEFGYGLSYTTFSCSTLQQEKQILTLTIKNIDKTSGNGIVLVYWIPNQSGTNGIPLKRLIAFGQSNLLAYNESQIIHLSIYDEWYNSNEYSKGGKYYLGGSCDQ